MSSGDSGLLEHAEDVARQVALETPDRFPDALALAGLALDVGDRGSVVLPATDDDRVQGAVQLTVSARVEPVADRLAGAGRDRGGRGEAGGGGGGGGAGPGGAR